MSKKHKHALNDDELESVAGGQSGAYRDTIHVVKEGETLASIAQRYKTTVEAILQLNPGIKDPGKISVGQRIAVRREKI